MSNLAKEARSILDAWEKYDALPRTDWKILMPLYEREMALIVAIKSALTSAKELDAASAKFLRAYLKWWNARMPGQTKDGAWLNHSPDEMRRLESRVRAAKIAILQL